MKILNIETGNFKADGGAIFGVVPKAIWSKKYKANENNLCNISARSILIDNGERKILVDTGIGNKQDEKWLSYHYLNGDSTLVGSLRKNGYNPEDITDVILTHLHWDHCGGAVIRLDENSFALQFPNALHWVSKQQWEWALNPNKREAPSYPSENILPLQESGKLKLIDNNTKLTNNIELRLFFGHTAGLMLPLITNDDKKYFFTGDLIPVMGNIPLPYISAYDILPLKTLVEKESILCEALKENWTLIFQHDLDNKACTLIETKKGIREAEILTFEDL